MGQGRYFLSSVDAHFCMVSEEKNSTHLCGLDLFKLHCYFIVQNSGFSFCSFLKQQKLKCLCQVKLFQFAQHVEEGMGCVWVCVQAESLFCSLAVGQTFLFACLTSVIFKELQCNLKHCSDENVVRTNKLYFFFSQL